ncbi:ATP-dependent nuclease [Tumebacillus algifaecis]|uniref:ATP-dependent nuclease n=1 Tax=Tumebacillus algifaecis TaxID=1214604 RepID=UPI0012FD4687|nr:AAA family ATPase [Tumebacillus algifaecis]
MIKIESLQIENFRSIRSIRLENLSDVNIFIGKNNAGKSNILRAINCFTNAIHLEVAYSTGIFTIEDINLNNDISIIGIIRVRNHKILICVRSLIINGEVLCLILPFRLFENNSQFDFGGLIVKMNDTVEEYAKVITRVVHSYRRLNSHNEIMYELKEDMTKILNKGLKVPPYEAIDYIEKNFQFSQRTFGSIRQHQFATDNIEEELVFFLNREIEGRKAAIDRNTKMLLSYGEDVLKFWTVNYYSQNRASVGRDFIWEKGRITMRPLVTSGNVLYQNEIKSELDEKDVSALFTLKNRKEHHQRWENIKKAAKKVLDIELDVFWNEEQVPTIDVDKKWVNLNGTGIREVLRTILDLNLEDVDIALMEEPEIHLHFDLELKLSQYLLSKSQDTQIFITTHSTAFVENAQNQSVFLVKKDVIETREQIITQVSPLPANNLIDAAKELGVNVNALLIQKVLVYVEGKTDRFIMESYLRKYHDNIYNSIGFVDMKGESNFEHYAEASSMKVFENSQLKTFFILDSDNRTDASMEQKKKDHPEGSKLHFWTGSCIETLFLSPEILLKFIHSKTNNPEISLKEVTEKQEKILNDLKLSAFRKYLREEYLRPVSLKRSKKKWEPVHDFEQVRAWFTNKKQELQEKANREVDVDSAFQSFNDNWEADKFKRVPGDKFLEVFCKEFGSFTYDKDLNNVDHLIGSLEHTEWPKEFVEVMARVVGAVRESGAGND